MWSAARAPEADESGWGWSEAGEEARCVRVRRLEARRKADRIVTERYHRGRIEAETAIMCRTATPRNADFSRLGQPAPQTKREWRLRCRHGGDRRQSITDPDQSAWWLLAPARDTVVGATIPYLSALGPMWAAACVELNAIGMPSED